mmetsp:Transcript_15159/g.37158  ORF Transcript_15159/g.37158 Transcript_15159/m.37158 type:complete len:95 (+) Transcript_15159:689-973(+)
MEERKALVSIGKEKQQDAPVHPATAGSSTVVALVVAEGATSEQILKGYVSAMHLCMEPQVMILGTDIIELQDAYLQGLKEAGWNINDLFLSPHL